MSNLLISAKTVKLNQDRDRAGGYDPIHNPFSIRYVQPGAIPYFFEREQIQAIQNREPVMFQQYLVDAIAGSQDVSTWVGAQFLADRFEKCGYKAQIVGPHGSGKSTLMRSLLPVWESRGYSVFTWSLHDQQRFLPRDFWHALSVHQQQAEKVSDKPLTVFLDGYEQLSFFHRILFGKYCRKHHLGYLISTHLPVLRIPTLYRTTSTQATVRRLIDYLIDDERFFPTDEEVQDMFSRNRGNCRSILFDLYDLYEEAAFGGF